MKSWENEDLVLLSWKKNKLKTKKMRLDVLMGVVSGILSYDQKMKGKVRNIGNMFFSISKKKTNLFLTAYQEVS